MIGLKIERYKKGKKNIYLVTIDGKEYSLYDDIIVKYSLLLKKELTKNEFTNVLKENEKMACYYEAINYLNKKMRTAKEVKQYLEKKEYQANEITNTIKELQAKKYIDETAYANAYIMDTIRFKKDGPLKIKEHLEQLGIQEPTPFIEAIERTTWSKKCLELATKKIHSNHSDSVKYKIKKTIQYLVSLGYPNDFISEAMAQIEVLNDPTIIQKEYVKIKQKLSRKYTGKELEFQVKIKLQQKGFTTEDLENLEKK